MRKVDIDNRARTERLSDWFDLQLQLVDVLVTKSNLSLENAVNSYTTFSRRFGFERMDLAKTKPAPVEWLNFLHKLSTLEARAARLEWTKTFAKTHLETFSTDESAREFGCFNFVPPNEKGVVRIHFAPNDKEAGTGPLSRNKVELRRFELGEMFNSIGRYYPQTQYVMGGSWLYNLDAYKRLFPPEYIDSCAIYRGPMTLTGLSSWGQFLDHSENIKAKLKETFLVNLQHLDLDALWKLFPMPPMLARAPISVFYDFYSSIAKD